MSITSTGSVLPENDEKSGMKTFFQRITLLSLSAAFSLSAVEIGSVNSPAPLPEKENFEQAFQQKTAALLQDLKTGLPDNWNKLKPSDAELMTEKLLELCIPGIIPTEKYVSPPFPKPGKRYFLTRLFRENTIFCIRMDSCNDTVLKKYTLPKNVKGVILDLRRCSNGDYTGIETGLSTLLNGEIPLVILVSHETFGTGELLAYHFSAEKKTLVMGESTFGHPFPMKKIRLRNKDYIYPVRPSGTDKFPVRPLVPALVAEPFPMWTPDTDKTENEILKKDPLLRRALELLSAVNLIQ